MIQRELEPEYMDDPMEARAYDEMDHSVVNAAFADNLLSLGEPGALALDVGTGTALIPINVCDRHRNVHITAVDAATTMLDVARVNIAAAGHAQRINLVHVDAKTLPFEDDHFDCVMSNSLVHHLPQPAVALREMVRVLKSGGRIFVRDLLRPESLEQVEMLVALHAANETLANQQLLRQSLRAALTLSEMNVLVAELGFEADSIAITSDRHWTWSAKKMV